MAIQTPDHAQPSDPGQPIRVEVNEEADLAVCSVAGCADPADLNRLAATVNRVARSTRHVVLDLDELTLVHPEALSGFLARLAGRKPLLLCCSRLSGRRLLRRCGAARVGAVVPSVEDALRLLDPGGREPRLPLPR
jgi:hypothetical protein